MASRAAIFGYPSMAIGVAAVGALVLLGSPWIRAAQPLPCSPERAAALERYVATISARPPGEAEARAPVVGSMTPLAGICTEKRDPVIAAVGGAVLLIGGTNADGATGVPDAVAWDGAERMPFGRLTSVGRGLKVIALADGRVLVAGGLHDLVTAAREIELGTPGSPDGATWERSGSLATPRWLPSATLLADGASVMFAGGGNETRNPLGSVELWHDGRVTAGGSLDVPRIGHTATLLADGSVLVAGGGSDGGHILDSAELYEPSTRTARRVAPMREPRRDHTATRLADGRVLVVGGDAPGPDRHRALASTEIFDPRAGTWSPAASLAFARVGHTALRLRDGRVVIAGGAFWVCNNWCSPRTVEAVEIWDPATDRWSAIGRFPSPDVAMTVKSGGQVMLVGAEDGWGRLLTTTWRP